MGGKSLRHALATQEPCVPLVKGTRAGRRRHGEKCVQGRGCLEVYERERIRGCVPGRGRIPRRVRRKRVRNALERL
ncbi:MAG: hypothetical protein ACFFAS_20675 [Promethearchaeota archaeon]